MLEKSADLEVDVLIIGSGIAGLTSAIYLLEQKLSVAIVSKEYSLLESNTYWAQGGIIYPIGDKSLQLDEDIQIASHHTSNQESINLLTKYGAKVIDDILLKKAKSNFQREIGGELSFTREAAHAQSRIIYKDDRTGNEIETSLWNYLNQYIGKGLTVFKQFTALDLITPAHHGISLNHRYLKPQVLGAYLFSQTNNKVIRCLAKKTILATGGIGSIFLHHTNSEGARGDGHAMASRAGAYMINMEFVQFHPTTFYRPSHHRRFLISEALRGEGGIIKDVRDNTFMHKYHEDCELAPRDVVSRAILQHLIENGDEHVLLDISHKDSNWIQKRFPTIYSYCLEQGIDITKEPIPVVPAAHYSCGGIWVDGNGCSSLSRLYAVGEVACTGLHGSNRLASTSLLEGMVWAYTASKHIKETIDQEVIFPSNQLKDWVLGHEPVDLNLVSQDLSTLRQTMWNYVGIKRSKNRLMRGRAMFYELQDEIQKFYKNAVLHDQLIGLRNAVEVGFMVINASMRNQKSEGCFYLEEDPKKITIL